MQYGLRIRACVQTSSARFRERKVTQKSENCGEPCTADLKEVESCNTHDCGIVVDCTLGEWTPCQRRLHLSYSVCN